MRWLEKLFGWFAGKAEQAGSSPLPDTDVVRPATWGDVETVAGLLEKHGVAYVLIGGYALHANGLIRATGDVDILVRNTPENNARWIAALSELPDGAASGLNGEPNPFPVDADTDDEPGVIRIFDEFVVDVLPKACGCSYEDLEPYIARLEEPGRGINVLDLDGLSLTKRGARDKDRSDLQQIAMALDRLRQLRETPAPKPSGHPAPER